MTEKTLIWVYNIFGVRTNAIVATDLEMDERLFQSYTIKFSVPAEHPKAIHLTQDQLLIINGERFFVQKIEKVRNGPQTDIVVFAEATWMQLCERKITGSFVLDNTTARIGLEAALSGTGWFLGEVTPDVFPRSFEATDATVLDIIWQWAKVCGCELSFDNDGSRVNMLTQVGANLGLGFRYGRNLIGITRTELGPTVTKLWVFGRNDLSIENLTGGAQYIEDFSYFTDLGQTLDYARYWHRKEDVYRDDSFVEDGPLYDAALKRIQTLSHPQVSYALSVVDLSALTGLQENAYRIGDTVHVADEVLGIDIAARVTRTVRYPASPDKNQIELSAGEILLPDPNAANARANTTTQWEMFESRNWLGPKQIRTFSTILNRIGLRAVPEAEWIVSYSVAGTGAGTGNITITPVDDETGATMWPARTFAVSSGTPFNWNFSYGQKDIPQGGHILVIRAEASAGGLNIAPLETALWVHARGITRENVVLTNSIRFDYTGAVQTWQVPDDVFEIMAEVHGGGSVYGGTPRSGGGKVVAKFPVLGGQIYDVYVGGKGAYTNSLSNPGAWPNGGDGASSSIGAAHGGSGGGSSDIRPTGTPPDYALIMAGAAGGASEANHQGGIGGFYGGGQGEPGGNNKPGNGAFQVAPGVGYGASGSFWQGGHGSGSHSAFAYPGGGGGGGWYGGAAAGDSLNGIAGSPGGGGGGSGWMHESGYDLETEDGENMDHGYVIISWEPPPPVT